MLDIGFPELMLIAIVGLLVIGPERLPGALRTLGLWLGRLRRSFTNVKAEIEKEIGMDEVRRQLHNESIMEEMKRIEEQVHGSVEQATIHQPANPATTGAGTANTETSSTETNSTDTNSAEKQDADSSANREPAPATINNPPTAQPIPPSEADLEAEFARKQRQAAGE